MTADLTAPRAPRNLVESSRPHAFFLEQERAASGEVVKVATVFLTNRECPWRCVYCDLWKNTLTETVPVGAILAQIDFALAQAGFTSARQIKLYNAGSFFDPKAIPPEDWPAVAERVRGFENVIVECHPALVGPSALRFRDMLRTHAGGPSLEVALGLEIADDAILARLNKRMTLALFRQAAEFLIASNIAVRAFIMVKPPFVRMDGEALDFARRSIDFALAAGASVVSLIPARGGTEELAALARSGDFSPPRFETLEAALDYGLEQGRGRVFADLWDAEKLPGCPQCAPARVERLRQMGLTQEVLPELECKHAGRD